MFRLYGLFIVKLFFINNLYSTPRHVFLLMVDDLRPEIASYGSTTIVTPNIDQFSQDSRQFNRAYCQQALCLPSRISMMSGLYPHETGVLDLKAKYHKMASKAVLIPEFFKSKGFLCIGMGKVYHDENPEHWDKWIDVTRSKGLTEYKEKAKKERFEARAMQAHDLKLKGKSLRQYTKVSAIDFADEPDEAYHDGAMVQVAIGELERLKPEQRLFMTLGFKKPHLPFIAPKKYWDLYGAVDIPVPKMEQPPKGAPLLAQSSWGEMRVYMDIPKVGPVSDDQALTLRRAYMACVSFVDAQIGRFIHALKERGIYDESVVVLVSDHGYKLGDYGMWCKHTNHEIDNRVPLIIRFPHQPQPGVAHEGLVELVDLFPTLLELTGFPLMGHQSGKSLVPALHQPQRDPGFERALSMYRRDRKTSESIIGWSVVDKKGRYTTWRGEETQREFAAEYYRHDQHPWELKNIHKSPELEPTIRDCEAWLEGKLNMK